MRILMCVGRAPPMFSLRFVSSPTLFPKFPYIALQHPTLYFSTVMCSLQDDFCILLSKNIEPEERKQAPQPPVAAATSDTTAPASANILRTSAVSGSTVPAASVPAPIIKSPPNAPAPSVVPAGPVATLAAATSQPAMAAGGGAVGAPASPANVDCVSPVASGDALLVTKNANDALS